MKFIFQQVTATYKDIAKWVAWFSIPLVGQRTKANQEFKYTKTPLVVIYYDVNFSHQYVKGTLFFYI